MGTARFYIKAVLPPPELTICLEYPLITLLKTENKHFEPNSELFSVWQEAIHFFQTLLSSQGSVLEDEILDTIPSLVTEKDNKMLTSPPNTEEVQKGVFSMSARTNPK